MGTSQITFLYVIWGPLRSLSLLTISGPLWSLISLLTIYGVPGPQIIFFAYYMYMGNPSDHFLRLLYRAPLGLFLCILYMGAPRDVSFFAYYVPRTSGLADVGPPSDKFLRLIFRGSPQISFQAYYVGAPSDQFLCFLYGSPQISFFRILYGGPFRSLSLLTIGPPQISFFAYYMGVPFRHGRPQEFFQWRGGGKHFGGHPKNL